MLTPTEAGSRLAEQVLRFDREHRAYGFVVQNGALVAEPVPTTEVPPLVEVLE